MIFTVKLDANKMKFLSNLFFKGKIIIEMGAKFVTAHYL